MTYPVKYMVVDALIGWKLIDTSAEGKGRTVKWFLFFDNALWVCRSLNNEEGFRYDLPLPR